MMPSGRHRYEHFLTWVHVPSKRQFNTAPGISLRLTRLCAHLTFQWALCPAKARLGIKFQAQSEPKSFQKDFQSVWGRQASNNRKLKIKNQITARPWDTLFLGLEKTVQLKTALPKWSLKTLYPQNPEACGLNQLPKDWLLRKIKVMSNKVAENRLQILRRLQNEARAQVRNITPCQNTVEKLLMLKVS